MKLFYVSISLIAAITALSTTGCGKSQDSGPNNGGVAAGAAAIPPPIGAGTIPTGCYYNNFTGYYGNTQCSPCPSGYTQSGNTCSLLTNPATSCLQGNWTGASCQPTGFQCPAGTTFSYQYGGCLWVGNGYPPNYQNYQYAPNQNGYIYYYTGNSGYQPGYSYFYYFNGYSWIRRSF